MNEQTQFMQQLQSQYQTVYGENQQILQTLTQSLQPLISAGASQQGFTPQETAALNSQATEGSAQAYKQAAQATNEQMAARGGGNEFIPSAATGQINAQLGISAENNLANEKLGITQANYNQGLKNYQWATGALAGVPGALQGATSSAAGIADQAGAGVTNASAAAANEANAINSANNSWLGILGGVAGAAVGGLTGNMFGGGSQQVVNNPGVNQLALPTTNYTLPNIGGYENAQADFGGLG